MKIQREGVHLIAKINQTQGRMLARILKKAGIDEINPAQGRVLLALRKKDEIPISELAQRTLLCKSALTGRLDRLEEAGYIARVHSRKDRRTILIKRTEKDRLLETRCIQVYNEMIDLFYSGFAPEEVESFEAQSKRILANLTKRA